MARQSVSFEDSFCGTSSVAPSPRGRIASCGRDSRCTMAATAKHPAVSRAASVAGLSASSVRPSPSSSAAALSLCGAGSASILARRTRAVRPPSSVSAKGYNSRSSSSGIETRRASARRCMCVLSAPVLMTRMIGPALLNRRSSSARRVSENGKRAVRPRGDRMPSTFSSEIGTTSGRLARSTPSGRPVKNEMSGKSPSRHNRSTPHAGSA